MDIAPLEDVDPLVAKMVSFLDEGYGVGTQISIRWREPCNSLVQECEAVMTGQKTPEQALADVEATVESDSGRRISIADELLRSSMLS